MKTRIPFNGRSAKNFAGAQSVTDKLKSELAKAVATAQHHTLSGSATVEIGLERWLSIHSIGIKPRSAEFNGEIIQILRNYWKDGLQKSIEQVTEAECVGVAESIAHYSTTRYNACVSALQFAIPAARILPRKSPPHPDHQIPTPEEFNRLLLALDKGHGFGAGMAVRFLAHTGLRINEARKLLWTDVREDHIYARGEITKNGKPRCIPFIQGTNYVLQLLRNFPCQKADRKEYVLPHASCRKALDNACRAAGLTHFSHHTFRHYFTTRCIVSGVDIPTVAKWLGHTDNGVLLLKTYCHLLDEHSRAMAERVRVFGNLAHPEILVSLQTQPVTQPSVTADVASRSNIVELILPNAAQPMAERSAL